MTELRSTQSRLGSVDAAPTRAPSDARSALVPPRRAGTAARWLKRALLASLTLAAIAGAVVAWRPEPIAVELAEVRRGPLQVTVDEDGRTRVRQRYMVSAPLLASVARIELVAGTAVRTGQVLARMIPLEPPLLNARIRAQTAARIAAALAARSQAQTAVTRSRGALEFAHNEAQRQRTLRASGASSDSTVERAELEERTLRDELASTQFAARAADHELQLARLELERRSEPAGSPEQIEILSPLDGQVLKVVQESAGAVQPGSPLLELGDVHSLEVVADVLTSEAVQIKPGARALIEHWGGAQALRAHVRSVEPSAFTRLSALGVEEQRVNVLLDLDDPRSAWSSLGDGYRVEVRIFVWEGTDLLSAPASAVFRHRDHWASYEIRSGRAHLVTLELGRRSSDRVEITGGLDAGARVVVHPSDRLADGARVQPR